ncbi:hypothetical protein [Kocuria sp. UCD-OTCP]|uniref:hypothetical protein n=1 Tax=Kocuria sp. UCD-OTCP TaxID=1292021 RepID=UPI0003787218|nr:hypothetical protein [Kocuria sp. UCD-OTCP]EYT53616.1 hypothetical protein H488_0106040 [Kocuria sp. UCD-OTCP]
MTEDGERVDELEDIPDLTRICKTKQDWIEAAQQLQRRNHRLQELLHRIQTDAAREKGGAR